MKSVSSLLIVKRGCEHHVQSRVTARVVAIRSCRLALFAPRCGEGKHDRLDTAVQEKVRSHRLPLPRPGHKWSNAIGYRKVSVPRDDRTHSSYCVSFSVRWRRQEPVKKKVCACPKCHSEPRTPETGDPAPSHQQTPRQSTRNCTQITARPGRSVTLSLRKTSQKQSPCEHFQ